jgi:methylthioribose-1-phosphate isomerase
VKIQGKHYQTLWVNDNEPKTIQVIDQRKIPFRFEIMKLKTVDDVFFAIREMVVRGAPLIGVTAAYSIYLALLESDEQNFEPFLLGKSRIPEIVAANGCKPCICC